MQYYDNVKFRYFRDLTAAEQTAIALKFELPSDTSELKVDEYNRPFERIAGVRIGCTVKNNNFHVHGNKNNGRA